MTDPSTYLDEKKSIWIGSHSPGWSIVISTLEPRTTGFLVKTGNRLLTIGWLWEIHGLHDLNFFRDGDLVEAIPSFPSGELDPGPELEPFSLGLPREGDEETGEEKLAHAFLTIVGRMTGRFIDDDWFLIPGRTYNHRISEADA